MYPTQAPCIQPRLESERHLGYAAQALAFPLIYADKQAKIHGRWSRRMPAPCSATIYRGTHTSDPLFALHGATETPGRLFALFF